MKNSKPVLQDIEEFKTHVMALSQGINKAGVEWQDEKFKELTKAIQSVAKESRELLDAGEACEKAIELFSSYEK